VQPDVGVEDLLAIESMMHATVSSPLSSSSAAGSSEGIAATVSSPLSTSTPGSARGATAGAHNGSELRRRTQNATGSEKKFGSIQLTIRYSVTKSQLVVVVHQCRNLIPCDASDNLADPYVRLFLLPDQSSKKCKTEVIKNNLNPVFDEQFEWSVSRTDVVKRTLEVSVKNHVGFSLKKDRVNMGQLRIDLSSFNDISTAITDWYDLLDPDVPL
jgi:hypothetical protein